MIGTQDNFQKEIIEVEGKVLVDFWAPWCAPCVMMSSVVDELSKDYKVVKVNVDEEQALASQYEISAIPAFLVFENGNVVNRKTGFTSANELKSMLT